MLNRLPESIFSKTGANIGPPPFKSGVDSIFFSHFLYPTSPYRNRVFTLRSSVTNNFLFTFFQRHMLFFGWQLRAFTAPSYDPNTMQFLSPLPKFFKFLFRNSTTLFQNIFKKLFFGSVFRENPLLLTEPLGCLEAGCTLLARPC